MHPRGFDTRCGRIVHTVESVYNLLTMADPAKPDDTLSRDARVRYARQLVLPDVGEDGQRRLRDARVAIVGAGGLGSPAAIYLAGAGVGTIGLVEFDRVDRTNLHRQILYADADVGRAKLDAARDRLLALNPTVTIVTHGDRLDARNALDVLRDYDVVLDGSDNFATRYLVNDACALLGKPDVYGSVHRFEGQVSVFATPGGPCYRCLFPEPPPPERVPNCADAGVLGVLPGTVGAIQATEAIKLVLGVGEPLVGRLMHYDALAARWHSFAVPRDPACALCGESPTIRSLDDAAAPAACAAARAPRIIDAATLRVRLADVDPPIVIDVRGADDFARATLPHAASVPMDTLDEWAASADPSSPVVVICQVGIRSVAAADSLVARGFADVSALDGGLAAWHEDDASRDDTR